MEPDTPESIALLNTVFRIIGKDPITSVFGTPVEDLEGPIPTFLYQFDLSRLNIADFPVRIPLEEIFAPYTLIDDAGQGSRAQDFILGTEADDFIRARGGNDIVEAGDGDDRVFGGGGSDVLGGGAGADRLVGGGGNDFLFGNEGNDRLIGGNGGDSLSGGEGNDRLFGDAGNDRLFGDDGRDRLDGGTGRDSLNGGSGNDSLFGRDGSDTIDGGTGNDEIFGGAGNDQLTGGGGGDSVYGGDGNDNLRANASVGVNESTSSLLDGGAGRDVVRAESLDGDIVIGGTGNDSVFGGGGDDTFIFRDGDGSDTIIAFGVGQTNRGAFNPQSNFRTERFEGFDTLVIDKAGFDSFDDIEDLIVGSTIDFGDGDRLVFSNFNPLGGLPSDPIGPSLNADNIVFLPAEDFIA